MIFDSIKKLVTYGLETGLIEKKDRIYTINYLLSLLNLHSYEEPEQDYEKPDLEETLREILDYACENGIIGNNIVERDLFDTKIMGVLTPRPSTVTEKFWKCYGVSPKTATDYFYNLSCNSDYIRRYRIKKDMKWSTETPCGQLDITINLSKPEREINTTPVKNIVQSDYPICMLCVENEGFCGNIHRPARQTLRIIPIEIDGNEWGFQYSPYVYYNEHCIVFNSKHVPMSIDKNVFAKLFSFVKKFPHYFLGSNADLPIVGGSILTHEHFQGGHYTFAMEKAPIETKLVFKGFEDVEAGIVRWPMSVIRLKDKDTEKLCKLGGKILTVWRDYTDEESFIFAETENTPHNTITPIARKNGDIYELDLVLRNNITTEEFPFGVYNPHPELHNIKKENIGLIEVLGLAVLPPRLKNEFEQLEKAIINGEDIRSNPTIEKHADWAEKFMKNYPDAKPEQINGIIQQEVGKAFYTVLEQSGIYKHTEDGKRGFMRFIDCVNG
jgi:UDPglucose--hexose-1-phosphate uridylyltransferase